MDGRKVGWIDTVVDSWDRKDVARFSFVHY